MQEYRAPGVRIEDLLTEHTRVLQPGVPVFLGLVSQAAIEARNDELNAQDDLDDQFLCKPLAGRLGAGAGQKARLSEAAGSDRRSCVSNRS